MQRATLRGLIGAASLAVALATAAAQEAAPFKGEMRSRWADAVEKGDVLPEYPRPLMVRDEWTA